MTIPLLTTKLYIPPPRLDLIPRPRLIEQLNIASSKKFTLVSAPAGFGKSTLVSSWAHQANPQLHIAWLSLEEDDNDLTRFLAYMIAALQTIKDHIGQRALVALQSPGVVNIEVILIFLLNEMAEFSDDVVLVIDDYHVIESKLIDQAITFLLDHLPPQMHLVISSRIDPSLPLSRLRARRDMIEIRVNDLRFTRDEASAFLSQVLGFDLPSENVASLEKRTEGWIAGLQLAALSMQSSDDIDEFVRAFSGSNRYILDYLGEEVLAHQIHEVKIFLLQTSILDRLTAPLCDAVTGETNGEEMLESLERGNLFIIPLDNERHWYRYHHLFSDLLYRRLRKAFPELILELHQRASFWYQCNDYPDDAIHHALIIGDQVRLADIIEEYWHLYVHRGEFSKLIELLDLLGPQFTKKSTPLSMAYAWIHYYQGNLELIPEFLEDIYILSAGQDISEILKQPTEFAVIPSLVETMQASLSLAKKDVHKAKAHAQKAISLIPEDPDPIAPPLLKAAAYDRLAQTYLEAGENDRACELLLEVMQILKVSNDYYGVGNTLSRIVNSYKEQGRVVDAIILCEETLDFISEEHWENIPPSGLVNLLLADLQIASGNYDEAKNNLEIGRGLVEPINTPEIASLVNRVAEQLDHPTLQSQPLVEPLSKREIEILHLIAQGLSNRKICERLFLALSTVKGHNRNIFDKLQVQNRTEAVTRARELGLL